MSPRHDHWCVWVTVALFGLWLTGVARADVKEADTLYNAGKWAESSKAYEEALPRLEGAEKARALSQQAYCLERLNKIPDAMVGYQAAITTPGCTGQTASYAQSRLGYLYIQPGKQYDKAIEMLLAVADIPGAHPNYIAEAYLYASVAANKAGRDDQSIDILRRIEPLVKEKGATPNYLGDAYMRMGRLYQSQKKYPAALEQYKKLLALTGSTGRQRAWARGLVDELELLAQGNLPFYIQPYVTNVSHDRAEIFWVTQGEASTGSITLTDPAGKSVTVSSQATPIKDTVCHQHKAVVENLTPNTLYHYTASCGGQTREGQFRANPTTDQDVEVIIGVTGDTQAAPDIHLAVAKQIALDHPDFTLHVGDLTDLGSMWSKWRTELYEPAMPYLHQGAFWPAIGNHDGGPYFPILFNRPKQYWTSFDYGPVHVAIIDSYWSGASRRGDRPKQLKWLEEDLAATKATWKIVTLHVPMIATRDDVDWFGEDDFLPLMEKMGVDMVLSGHHPMYRKYLPTSAGGNKPIYHVTTGGGGPTGAPVPSPILEVGSPYAHATILHIKGNRLQLDARLTDGTPIDHFVLIKNNGRYQDEVMAKAVDRNLVKKTRHLYQELLDEQNNQLVLGMEGSLKPGQPVRFVLDTAKLPRGALKRDDLPAGIKLLLKPAAGSRWGGEEIAQALDQDKLVFTFTAPQKLTVGAGSFRPTLTLEMNLEVGGRRLQPFPANVRLDQAAAQQAAADIGGLPAVWDFRIDPDDRGQREQWYDASASGQWGRAPVTTNWEVVLDKEYDGIGWYRAAARTPDFSPGQRVWLEFGSVDESCWVYVNGQLVGSQVYDTKVDDDAWHKPRRFDITDVVHHGAAASTENLFVVRVQDLFGIGGINGSAVLKVEPANELSHGGIDGGLAGWTVAKPGGQDLALSVGNAKYVGEHALLIDHRDVTPVIITRTFDADLTAGSVEFFARFTAQPMSSSSASVAGMEGAAAAITVFLSAGTEGKPSATISVPATGDRWITLSQPINVAHGGKQPVTVRVEVRQRGTYALDEVGISAVE